MDSSGASYQGDFFLFFFYAPIFDEEREAGTQPKGKLTVNNCSLLSNIVNGGDW